MKVDGHCQAPKSTKMHHENSLDDFCRQQLPSHTIALFEKQMQI